MSAQPRAYSAAHFVLELGEKEVVGFPRSVEGGNLKAEIMSYKAGRRPLDVYRQLSKPKISDIKFTIGMGASENLYKWLSQFFTGEGVRKDGAIVAGDFHYTERARRNFYSALISELQFPKLDGSDRNACQMTVTLAPERMDFAAGSGKALDHTVARTMAHKLWTANNFRFSIDGFEDACARVMSVEGFSIKQKILEYPAGHLRQPLRVPGPIEWPNITFTVPEVDAKPFIDHFKKHVITGEPQASARLNGAIDFLDQEGVEMAELSLRGVDIASIDHDKSDAGSDDIKKVKIEISIESIDFVYGEAAVLV